MDLPEAIQLASLQAVLRHKQRKDNLLDLEYTLRKIFRWYSKTFHTPLHEVDSIPLSDVLAAYWEEHYEELEDKDLEVERIRLIEDEEELKLRQIEEDANEVDVWEIGQEEKSAAEEIGAAATKLVEAVQHLKDESFAGFSRSSGDETRLVNSLPGLKALPDIKMSFASEDEVDLDADTFGLLADPKAKK